ncbi:MAG: DUF2868 domain-containing protein [Desulfamplus sp.]|nr:DUF2868 domain-containing protein [Desulfamplus sp.]
MKWTIGHIIDFEYFLHQDSNSNDEDYLKKRDKDIYLNYILPKAKGIASRKQMLLLWLEAMKSGWFVNSSKEKENRSEEHNRKKEQHGTMTDSNLFIGDMYEEFLSLLKIVFVTFGIMSGVLLCLTFFSYRGLQPLNVAYFLTLTLLPQICLLTILALSFFISKFNIVNKTTLFPYPLVGVIIENIFMAIIRRVSRKLSEKKRESFLSAISVIKHGQQVYGLLFFLPIFIVMQIFGMAFNVGVLLSTLFRVLFFDTAFGWQSTLQISPQIVAKIVELTALPWGWILPAGVGFPDLEQIIGSRIILKDGIYHLTTNDLVSWWPFLSLAVLFYGFLPRFIMFISGKFLLKRSLEEQNFDHSDCSNLIHRMLKADVVAEQQEYYEEPVSNFIKTELTLNPNVKVKQPSISLDIKQPHILNIKPALNPDVVKNRGTSIKISLKPSIALIPFDIHDLIDFETFKRLMQQNHGYDIRKIVVIGIDFDKDIECIGTAYKERAYSKSKDMQDGDQESCEWSIVILQEAWQPPIRENLNLLKSIRKAADKKTPIIVTLTGIVNLNSTGENAVTKDNNKDASENFFTPVEQSDWEIWKNKLSTIADPWLTIEKVV